MKKSWGNKYLITNQPLGDFNHQPRGKADNGLSFTQPLLREQGYVRNLTYDLINKVVYPLLMIIKNNQELVCHFISYLELAQDTKWKLDNMVKSNFVIVRNKCAASNF